MLDDKDLKGVIKYLLDNGDYDVSDVLNIMFYVTDTELTGYERGSMDYYETMVTTILYYKEHGAVPSRKERVS